MRIIFSCLFLLCFFAPYAMSDEIETVSLMQLIVTPEKYAGKTIEVVGFVCFGFESDVIAFHKEDAEVSNEANSLWLTIKDDDANKFSKFSNSYARVIGAFHPEQKGHMGMYPGAIQVERVVYVKEIKIK